MKTLNLIIRLPSFALCCFAVLIVVPVIVAVEIALEGEL